MKNCSRRLRQARNAEHGYRGSETSLKRQKIKPLCRNTTAPFLKNDSIFGKFLSTPVAHPSHPPLQLVDNHFPARCSYTGLKQSTWVPRTNVHAPHPARPPHYMKF